MADMVLPGVYIDVRSEGLPVSQSLSGGQAPSAWRRDLQKIRSKLDFFWVDLASLLRGAQQRSYRIRTPQSPRRTITRSSLVRTDRTRNSRDCN
jgi:hypothetical protein